VIRVSCPECHRSVATRGTGAHERLAAHNGMTSSVIGRSHVSRERCDASGAYVLPLRIARTKQDLARFERLLSERGHAVAKATAERDEAQRSVDAARAALAKLEAQVSS